jgi:RNA polymerase sigma factor (sigma-70 family)
MLERLRIEDESDADLLRWWQSELARLADQYPELSEVVRLRHAAPLPRKARKVLCERYQRLVRSIAGKFRARPHDFEDYVQAGNLGLLAAIDKCESSRALSSYARPAIYRDEAEGPVYRPAGSEDSFKYRWAKSPAQKAMFLASEVNCFSDPLSPSFKSMPDWSFDYLYEFEDDACEYIEAFDADRFCDMQTFDRRGHEERIKLDHALETLDLRSRPETEHVALSPAQTPQRDAPTHCLSASLGRAPRRLPIPRERWRCSKDHAHRAMGAWTKTSRQVKKEVALYQPGWSAYSGRSLLAAPLALCRLVSAAAKTLQERSFVQAQGRGMDSVG